MKFSMAPLCAAEW